MYLFVHWYRSIKMDGTSAKRSNARVEWMLEDQGFVPYQMMKIYVIFTKGMYVVHRVFIIKSESERSKIFFLL
jgi:hypothetical protein